MTNEFELITREYDLKTRRACLYAECAAYEYGCAFMNSEEMFESTGEYDEDVIMEAGETFGQKIKAAIQKIREALTNLINKIKQKISNIGNKKALSESKKLIDSAKKDPNLNKIEVEIPDPKDVAKNEEYVKNLVKGNISKVNSGKPLTDSDKNVLQRALDKLKNPKVIKVGAVTAGSLVLAAITAGAIYTGKSANDLTKDLNGISMRGLTERQKSIRKNVKIGDGVYGNDNMAAVTDANLLISATAKLNGEKIQNEAKNYNLLKKIALAIAAKKSQPFSMDLKQAKDAFKKVENKQTENWYDQMDGDSY